MNNKKEQQLRVGFTGTRKGLNLYQLDRLEKVIEGLCDLITLGVVSWHHGDCIGGDSEFHDMVRQEVLYSHIIGHPPTKEKQRAFKECNELRPAKPFLIRDHEMVDEVGYLIVAPYTDEEITRSGTWATYRYAKKTKTPFIILYPRWLFPYPE